MSALLRLSKKAAAFFDNSCSPLQRTQCALVAHISHV